MSEYSVGRPEPGQIPIEGKGLLPYDAPRAR
jgi:hypothetical protein